MSRRYIPRGNMSRVANVVDFDSLPCECWCQSDIVLVSRRDVLALRTGSCGRPGCEEVA